MNDNQDNQMDTLATWLKDAYAMEQGIVEILERQIDQFDDMPDAQERLRQHLELTKTQAERVQGCLEILGEDVSTVKSGVANILGAVQGMSTIMASDKIVKNTLANYAIENFEIACYMSLATCASDLGFEDIAMVCDTIIDEEQDMAAWIEEQIPMVTRQHLMRVIHEE